MHWELHPTERPAHSQIPWFWIPESEIYPQLISIATVSEFIPELRRVAGFGLDDMFKVVITSSCLNPQLHACRKVARMSHYDRNSTDVRSFSVFRRVWPILSFADFPYGQLHVGDSYFFWEGCGQSRLRIADLNRLNTQTGNRGTCMIETASLARPLHCVSQ
jgi:hypothetical protein